MGFVIQPSLLLG